MLHLKRLSIFAVMAFLASCERSSPTATNNAPIQAPVVAPGPIVLPTPPPQNASTATPRMVAPASDVTTKPSIVVLIDDLASRYSGVGDAITAGALIEIDRTIREHEMDILEIDGRYYRANWRAIGLNPAHYEGIEYNDKLLFEARAKDPEFNRCYTAYAPALKSQSEHSHEFLIEPFVAYLDTCPHGEFAVDALLFLGQTYYDIFSAALNALGPEERRDQHASCFLRFLDEKQPLEPQAEAARLKAISYYERAKVLLKSKDFKSSPRHKRTLGVVSDSLGMLEAKKPSSMGRCWD